MGGSFSNYSYKPRNIENILYDSQKERIEKAKRSEINEFIDAILKDANDRNIEDINNHLNTIKKALDKKQENIEKVDIFKSYIFISLGTTITINFLLFIFLGRIIANIFKINNLFFSSILFATFFNIYIIYKNIKKYNSKN